MKTALIGIVDYGAGNHNSVKGAIKALGYRSRLVKTEEDLSHLDLLILPGVGAFSTAMAEIRAMGLDILIRQWAYAGKPLLGICLGMQMLAEASYEHGLTRGLELIPGEVKPIENPGWHIGWNRLEVTPSAHDFLKASYGKDFYFNHSYEFHAPQQYVCATARLSRPIVAVVKRDNVCGMQFHPEKSQDAGKEVLQLAIEDLVHA